jgi:general nucleoside transport system permease protein
VSTVAVAAPGISTTRSRVLGVVFILLGLAIALLFGVGSAGEGSATFQLNGPGQVAELPDLTLPAAGTSFVLAAISVFIGGVQLSRGFGKRTYVALAVVIACFLIAFLTWAAAGESLNFFGMLQRTLVRSVPLTLGALSGVLCERAGVINIAIEGMMLTAAFVGAIAGSAFGLVLGTVIALGAGALLGAVLAVLSIRYRVDQIIAGTVINIFALGITSYLTARVLVQYLDLNNPGTFRPFDIPILAKIPLIGPLLFRNNIFVYLMFILVAVVHIGLFRTRWGLRVRAVGEHPKAADTVGINVLRVRYRNVILGGMMAALAGAFLTLGSVGRFDENMTAGRGFIALAAMIFGRWNPIGAFGAALVFGLAESLQSTLAILQVPIPSEILSMAPYLATILVVAGVVGRARAPAADGRPYVKE